ncbi:class I SAM-dependent methyltransferase [Paenibacillus lycopersici]|uniref:class I SAM-dependent methyltransferase n=1 Tax=Paenibacillus lycopersici TaxID=2704462 RepID=UPI0017848FB0|nr:class I SAM-dependent methyltransferase [Paenibacillus lycopersici]
MAAEKRATFNEVAALYDQARNRYPGRLFEDLFAWTNLPPGARVLEIGAGTGIATLPPAEYGCSVTAIELGAGMAEVARAKLAAYPGVEVVNADFETWEAPEEPYDLVLSATAIHWIDPEVRYSKPAALLREGGYIALLGYKHAVGGDQAFFDRAQQCYEKFMPHSAKGRLAEAGDVNPHVPELAASGYFDEPRMQTCFTEERYDRDGLLGLLATYSDHRLLEAAARERLFACIGALIDNDYNGSIRKRYRNDLIVARKKR